MRTGASVVRRQLAFATIPLLLVLGGCIAPVGDNLDCSPHPVDVTSHSIAAPSSVVLASSCHLIIVVGENGVQYIWQGEFVLNADAIAGLREFGRISQANDDWAPNIETSADLVVWEVAGSDPGLALWGTSSTHRGTGTYILWTIDDCSEVDACEPPICDSLDMDDRISQMRCNAPGN